MPAVPAFGAWETSLPLPLSFVESSGGKESPARARPLPHFSLPCGLRLV